MRLVDKMEKLGRRAFLGRSAGALALVGTVGAFTSSGAFAATLKTVKANDAPTLVKMARDIYPHDRLPDGFYENAVVTIDAGVADDPAKKTLLAEGVATLNAAAMKLRGKRYADLTAEAERVAVLMSIEDTPFFTQMRSSMITALYGQPDVWTKLGYEGSSAEHGGYIHRGFNDIDWLPA